MAEGADGLPVAVEMGLFLQYPPSTATAVVVEPVGAEGGIAASVEMEVEYLT